MSDYWYKRRTTKEFTDQEVDFDCVKHIINLMNYVPQQRGGYPYNLWFIVGPDKQEFKDYLFKEVAIHYEGIDTTNQESIECFTQIKTAPYMFLCCRSNYHDTTQPKEKSVWDRNMGVMAGVLLSEILRLGYDASQIACFRGLNHPEHGDKKRDEFETNLWKTFDRQKVQALQDISGLQYLDGVSKFDNRLRPQLAIMMGHANKNLPQHPRWEWVDEENKIFRVTGQKRKLKHSGVIQ